MAERGMTVESFTKIESSNGVADSSRSVVWRLREYGAEVTKFHFG